MFATWKEPEAPPGPFNKVVAIALAQNESTRRIAEGRVCPPSPETHGRLPVLRDHPQEDEGDVDKVVARLRAEGIDGAAVFRLVEEEVGVAYDPGSFWRPYQSFNDFYGGVWSTYHDPGYLTTEIAVRIETAFYSVADAKTRLDRLQPNVEPEIRASGDRRRRPPGDKRARERAHHYVVT